MSITGTIVFYQRWGGHGSLRTRFAKLAQLISAEEAYLVARRALPFGHEDLQILKLSNLRREPYTLPVGDLLQLPRGIGTITAGLSAPLFGERVLEALRTQIPEELRDQFAAGDPFISMGWHLINDLAPGHRGPDPSHRRLARLSFSLFGYGAPKNWDEYRARIWETDVMRELEGNIVEAIGPVHRAISWSV